MAHTTPAILMLKDWEEKGMDGAMAQGFFSDEDIRKVREAADIVAVMGERSPMRQKGKDYWCCCPVHQEKTPSCKVDQALQLWHCFGCGEGGDLFAFLMKVDGVTFPEAVRMMADRYHVPITEIAGKQSMPTSEKARLLELCQEAADYYHMQLMRSKTDEAQRARDYLAKRELNRDIPVTWNLGFAPGRGQLVAHLRGKGFTQKEMLQANVAVESSGKVRDRFYDRVMFPIRDEQGRTIAFGGRVMGDGEPKYLNSNETPLFHKSNVLFGLDFAKAEMASTGIAVVVEGYTDVIAMHTAGIANVVATLGTALTRQHIRVLSRHAKKKIVYLFDGDAAGQHAAQRALQFIDASMTPEAGVNKVDLCAVTLPDNLDPADYLQTHSADDMRACIAAAKPLLQYGIESILEKFDLSKPEDRSRAFSEAVALLAPIKDSLLAKDYVRSIADRCRVREEDAFEALAKLKPAPSFDRDRADTAANHRSPYASHALQGEQHSMSAEGEPTQRKSQKLDPQLRNRVQFEREYLCLVSHYPQVDNRYVDALCAIEWKSGFCADLAFALYQQLTQFPEQSPAELIQTVTESMPDARKILTLYLNEDNPADKLQYLLEELQIGDYDEQIQQLKAELANAGSAEESELLYGSIVALQQDINILKAQHAAEARVRK